jgi:hypothetical protein
VNDHPLGHHMGVHMMHVAQQQPTPQPTP